MIDELGAINDALRALDLLMKRHPYIAPVLIDIQKVRTSDDPFAEENGMLNEFLDSCAGAQEPATAADFARVFNRLLSLRNSAKSRADRLFPVLTIRNEGLAGQGE